MAVAGSLTYDTKIDSDGFQKGLNQLSKSAKSGASSASSALNSINDEIDKIEKNTSSASSGFNKFSSGLGKIGSVAKVGLGAAVAGITAVTGALVAGAAAGVKYNATIEQYQTSFEVMTGSAEEAVRITEKLKELGAATPFEMTDLANVTQLLMNYGLTADEAIEKMQMLGDISQGSADKMDRIAMAYGQMSSAGKVQLEDVKQMIEAGFNPLQEISESTGESMASLYDRISKGTLSVDEITASMERSTSAGGKYFQSMEKQSQTINGQLSTLKDNASQLLGVLTEGLSDTIAGEVLPMLNEMTTELQGAFETGGIEAFSSKLGEVASELITKLAESLPQVFQMGSDILQNLLLGIQENLPTIATSVIQIIQTFITFIIENLPLILNMGIQLILQLILGITQAIPQMIPQIVNLLNTIINTIIENLPMIIQAGIQLLLALALGLIDAIPDLLAKIPEIIGKLVGALTKPEMLAKLVGAAIQLILALAGGLIQAIPEILAMTPRIIGELFSAIGKNIAETDWLSLGLDILKGILNGMLDFGNVVKNTIKKVGKKITNAIKDFFGIESPSKLMAKEIGPYLPAGIAVGIEANTDSVLKSIDAMDKEINAKMKRAVALETGDVNAQAKISSAVANNTVIQINAQFDGNVEMDKNKVGRIITPVVTKTIKVGGIR